MRHSTPVLILRPLHHGGLGIARSLGRLGAPVYAVQENRWTPVLFSRHCEHVFVWDVENAAPEDSVNYLLEAGRQIGRRSLLIPSTDGCADFVAEHQHALRDSFLFPSVPLELVRTLSSKRELHFLASRLGIPHPNAFFPQSKADVHNFLQGAEMPVMVKPIDDARLRRRVGKTKYVVRTRDELLKLYDRIEDPDEPNLMFQQYIPGGEDAVWMFNGYFDSDSECLFGVTGKKIRQFPAYTGAASLAVCLPNPAVEQTTIRFMKAIGYRGILDIGYRYDARDGRYKVLDVNPRIGSTFRLFVGTNGMDVARALYLDLTGRREELAAASSRPGRKWLVEDYDLLSSVRYFRDGKLSFTQWARSLRGVEETCFLSFKDPLPVLGALFCDLHELRSRVAGRARLLRNARRSPPPGLPAFK